MHQRLDDLGRRGPACDDASELPADLLGDLEQRAERARGEERIAAAAHNRHAAAAAAEGVEKRRLADSGFAGDEHDRTVTGRAHGPKGFLQHRQLGRPLEQIHYRECRTKSVGKQRHDQP